MLLCAALSMQVLFSCDSYRNMPIESNMTAEVRDWGGRVICASTPCKMSVSRETCWLFDSSSGYIILTARSRDGTSMRSMPITTCEVKNSMRVKFVFPSVKNAPNCAVILYDGDKEIHRLPCKDSLEK
jgi:hypothetical protein